MSKQTGKRIQIYIPADLIERWEQLPRYERSAEVAKALRAWWGIEVEGERRPPPPHRPKHADE